MIRLAYACRLWFSYTLVFTCDETNRSLEESSNDSTFGLLFKLCKTESHGELHGYLMHPKKQVQTVFRSLRGSCLSVNSALLDMLFTILQDEKTRYYLVQLLLNVSTDRTAALNFYLNRCRF